MKRLLYIFLFLFPSMSFGQVITIGPMLHCYFPKDKPKLTIGIEGAFHFFLLPLPAVPSIDFGVEIGNGIKYTYAELQFARPISHYELIDHWAGISFGLFKMKEKDIKAVTGYQITGWGTYLIGGGDFRFRFAKNYVDGGIGGFGKLPISLFSIKHI